MATTSSNLTSGKAIGGLGGTNTGHKGRAAGLVATAALGLALLTGVAIHQVRHETPPAAQLVAPVARLSTAARERERNLIIEQNTLPELTGTRPVMSVERQLFLEQNTQFPMADTLVFIPDQFTYREDHRASTTDLVPDFWTYREDRRADR